MHVFSSPFRSFSYRNALNSSPYFRGFPDRPSSPEEIPPRSRGQLQPLTVGRLTFVRGGASELWIVKTLRGGAQAGRFSSIRRIDLERKALTKAFYRKRKFQRKLRFSPSRGQRIKLAFNGYVYNAYRAFHPPRHYYLYRPIRHCAGVPSRGDHESEKSAGLSNRSTAQGNA